MPDLNLDLDYFDHPKTKRLIGLLGKGAEVLPIKLWAYCGKYHKEHGRLTGYSTQEIESILGWWGELGAFVQAMLKVRFLDGEEGDYACHNWADRNGHLGALSERNRAAANARWDKLRKERVAKMQADASGMPQALHSHDSGMPQPTNLPTNQEATDSAGAADNVEKFPLEETLLQHWGRAGRVGHAVLLQFVDLTRKHGWERMEYAIREAAVHGACNLAYVKGILEPKEKLDEVIVGSSQDYFAFQAFLTSNGKRNGEAYKIEIVTPGKEWKFSGTGITDLYKKLKSKRF